MPTRKASFRSAATLTLGTAGTTVTLSGTGGGLNRLVAGTDTFASSANNGKAYVSASGIQTIVSSILANANQTWAIGGKGEILLSGKVGNSAGTTILKSKGGTLEIAADNSLSFLGSYTAQGGTTLLSSNNALGVGTTTVQVSATTASTTADVSLLTSSGVTFAHNVNVAAIPNAIVATLGGAANQTGSSLWTGTITLGQAVSLTGGDTGTTAFRGAIGGVGNVNKTGAGTVILSAPNTYTGIATVADGTLLVNGTNSGGGAVSVNSGGVLGGAGSISTGAGAAGLSVANGGILAPTAGQQLIIIGDATLALSLDALTSNSLKDVGALALNSDSSLALSSSSPPTAVAYVLANYSTLSGTFGSITGLPDGYAIDYDYLNSNSIALVSGTVPEPTSLTFAAAASSLLLWRRRGRVRHADHLE